MNILIKINEKNNIVYSYEYKKTMLKFNYKILNKRMSFNIKKIDINQYFGDTSYRTLLSTFHKYRLYIICEFNIKNKHARIATYCLIPNETEIKICLIF